MVSRAPRQTQQQRSAATRQDLIRSCLRLFAKQGFHATSIDAVAAEVGLTKGAVYWHFAGKDALFDALLDFIRDEWRRSVLDPVRTAATPSAQLSALFDGYAELLGRCPEVCLFLQRVLLDADQTYGARVAAVYSQTAGVIATIFRRGIKTGEFRKDITPEARAYVVLGTLTGAHAQAVGHVELKLTMMIREAKAATMRSVVR
jgi:AcrR family transcriptional regulator